MLPKLLIVVTCLYVVKAVAPSALDDEETSNLGEVTRTARSCSYDGCNSFCRKLGHARGVCIGTYCQCRFRRSLDQGAAVENDEDNEKSVVSNTEESSVDHGSNFGSETFVGVSGEGAPEDSSNSDVSVRNCGYTECNNFCRKMGYARGVCIGTYCQCRSRMGPLFPSPGAQESALEDVAETGNTSPVKSDEESLYAPDQGRYVRQARSCGYSECNNHCRRLGHARGVCIGTYCQCRSRLARSLDFLEEEVSDNNLEDNVIPANAVVVDDELTSELLRLKSALSDCNLRWCEQNCRRIGFPGGVCVNGRCKCDLLRSALPAVPAPFASLENEEEAQSRQLRSCSVLGCAQICRRLGFRFSRCSNGRCYCW